MSARPEPADRAAPALQLLGPPALLRPAGRLPFNPADVLARARARVAAGTPLDDVVERARAA